MEEVFQSYEHYKKWLMHNWDTTATAVNRIVTAGLVIERDISMNGEPWRSLTIEEFAEKEKGGFIIIPELK